MSLFTDHHRGAGKLSFLFEAHLDVSAQSVDPGIHRPPDPDLLGRVSAEGEQKSSCYVKPVNSFRRSRTHFAAVGFDKGVI